MGEWGSSLERVVLKAENITKVFPGVKALDNVSFELYNEVHGILGENGAGKTTFINILNGIYKKDAGKIIMNGEEVEFKDPSDAKRYGVAIIHQQLSLMPNLTVTENIFFGREFTKGIIGFKVIDHGKMNKEAERILEALGVKISPTLKIRDLRVGEQQAVEIARAISENAKIITMDEPTSALSKDEIEKLFEVIGELKKKGISIIYISHHIDEAFQVCDRITVLRNGKKVATVKVSETTPKDVIRMMIGREIAEFYTFRKVRIKREKQVLGVKGLSTIPLYERALSLTDISFELYEGEILAVTGLMGAGKTELGRALIGVDPISNGETYLNGRRVKVKSPIDALKFGMIYVPEDRMTFAILPLMSVTSNITISSLTKLLRYLFMIDRDKEREVSADWVKKLRIVTPSIETAILSLSGGNQQKVILSRFLNVKPKVLIIDEPTIGIDVGVKVEIRKLINDLSMQGYSVILLTSEIEEALGLADRILVMRDGRIVAKVNREEATKDLLMGYATRIEKGK